MTSIEQHCIKFYTIDELYEKLKAADLMTAKCYNVILYKEQNKVNLKYYCKLVINICSNDYYNDIDISAVRQDIIAVLCDKDNNKRVQYWKQSDNIDKILKLYKPYIRNLAKDVYCKWSRYKEYEDILQDIYLTIIELHKKNYFLNKKIIHRSYLNTLYMEFRKFKNVEVNILPIDKVVGEKLCIKDTIHDEKFEEFVTDREQRSLVTYILNDVEAIVLQYMPERRWEQCKRAYITKTTSPQTAKTMQRVRQILSNFGISLDSFYKE